MYIFKLHIPIIKSYSLFLCRAILFSQTQIPILFICKPFRNPFCLLSFVFENFYILVGDMLISVYLSPLKPFHALGFLLISKVYQGILNKTSSLLKEGTDAYI